MGFSPLPALVLYPGHDHEAFEEAVRASALGEIEYGSLGGFFHLSVTELEAFDSLLEEGGFEAILQKLSQTCPLLYFWNNLAGQADDWGLRCFNRGVCVFEVVFSYNWPSYGEELRQRIDAALQGQDVTRLIACFPFLSAEQQATLSQLFDSEALFAALSSDSIWSDIIQALAEALEMEDVVEI